MINELICNKCGHIIKHKDYPDFYKARKAMYEHLRTNHGLIYYDENVKEV